LLYLGGANECHISPAWNQWSWKESAAVNKSCWGSITGYVDIGARVMEWVSTDNKWLWIKWSVPLPWFMQHPPWLLSHALMP